jgi:uncharacterized protein
MAETRGFAPGRHKIDDYRDGGFHFAGMSHRGSILALPSGLREIELAAARDITSETLDEIIAESQSGALDLLIVGTGAGLVPLPAPLRARLRTAGIGCETMATGTAVRTYNMLFDEGRCVGALLIAM